MYNLSKFHTSQYFDLFKNVVETGQFLDDIILTDFLKFFILGQRILDIYFLFWEFQIVLLEWFKLKVIFLVDLFVLLRIVERIKHVLIGVLFAVFRALFIIEFIGPFISVCCNCRVFSISHNSSLGVDILVRKRGVFLSADGRSENCTSWPLLSTHWFFIDKIINDFNIYLSIIFNSYGL